MKTTAVLRKDGNPFASKNNATTRMRALGLQDSHTVETYGDGYAIFPKAMNEERVTLQQGDYIATTDLSEDDYHNVARAFMAAGAGGGEYPNNQYFLPNNDRKWCFGIDDNFKNYHGHIKHGCFEGGRQLTLSQILSATNAGGDAQPAPETKTETDDMHLTDRLEAAILAEYEATQLVERLRAEYKAAYPGIVGCALTGN